MPSQRKKGLKLLGAFVTEDVHAAFNKKAESRGLDAAALLRELIEKYLDLKTSKKKIQ
ncbi:MAG: hypothetical protein ABIP97_02480 [Chthoniobacterales bacterium]